ncbi:MAG: hypothetical protein GX975_03285 [Clostridiales bacterium]|nr:hypothetical protein [Clostridiales bacterium]
MRKFGIALYTIFAVLFAGLPVYVLVMSSKAIERTYEDFGPELNIAIGIAAAVLLLHLIPKNFFRIPDPIMALLWIIAGTRFRMSCFENLQGYMLMKYDFADVLRSAGGEALIKEEIFTHWAFYPRLIAVWNTQRGEAGDSYEGAVYLNAIIGGLIVAVVYLIGARIFKRQRAANTAAAINCFWPLFAYYSAITSNEHPAMLFMLLASFFAICAWQAAESAISQQSGAVSIKGMLLSKKTLGGAICLLCAGFCAGAADIFKQFSPIFLVACAATGVVFLLIGDSSKAVPGEAAGKKPLRFAALALAIVIMTACAGGLRGGALNWLEKRVGRPVCRNASAHFLWIGLNSAGEGMWTREEGMKVYELADKYDGDYDRVMDELSLLLKEDLKANSDKLPETLSAKMEEDWSADTALSKWMRSLYDEERAWEDAHPGKTINWEVPRSERDLYDFDPGNVISKASAAMYMAVMGAVAVGALIGLFAPFRKPAQMYFRLLFYGYALVFLLSEAQGRYQVVLFPVFAVLAAAAVEDLSSFVIEFFKGKINKSGGMQCIN